MALSDRRVPYLVIDVLHYFYGDTRSLGLVAMFLVVFLHLPGQLEELALQAESVDILVSMGVNVMQSLEEFGVEQLNKRRKADRNLFHALESKGTRSLKRIRRLDGIIYTSIFMLGALV